MKNLIFSLIVLLTLPVNANATTGMELYNLCKATNGAVEAYSCAIYINGYWSGAVAGAVDTYHNLGFTQKYVNDKRVLCIPDNTTIGQITLMFKQYTENHPEELNNSATIVLGRAIKYGFCK